MTGATQTLKKALVTALPRYKILLQILRTVSKNAVKPCD